MDKILKIDSNDPDICGKWLASEIEEDLMNLEIPLEDENTWLKYILERILENYDIDIDAIIKVLTMNERISISMLHKGCPIHIQYRDET